MLRRLALLLAPLLATTALAQSAEASTTVLKDIDPTVDTRYGGGNSDSWLTVGTSVYFTKADTTHGEELWKTDGTEAGTVLVKDIRPGNRSSDPQDFTAAAGKLFFTANDGTHGRELWVSDGTDAGTHLVKDLVAGPPSGLYSPELTAFGGGALFSATTAATGREPWITDGTEAGTRLLKDIAPGSDNSNPASFFVDGATAYFGAGNPSEGGEVWSTDGTEAGTTRLTDLAPGGATSYASDFVRLGSQLIFKGVTTSGSGLYSLTGTTLTAITVLGPGMPEPTGGLVKLGIRVYYVCTVPSAGVELCDTDGTAADNELFADVVPGSGSSQPLFLSVAGNNLYFVASPDGVSPKLYSSNGSTVPSVVSGPSSSIVGGQAWTLRPLGGDMLFSAPDTDGYELWRANGTTATRVKDIKPGAGDSVPAGAAGTQSAVLGSRVLFSADDGVHGSEVWSTDGTSGGTGLVRDVGAQPMSSDPTNFTTVGNQIFFTASDPADGEELWVTDATTGGTRLVKDIRPGTQDSLIYNLTSIGSTLYFIASDGTHGRELWKSDGSAAGTTMVRDMNTGGDGVNLAFAFGNRLLLGADDGSGDGYELWITDGTDAGTTLLKSIQSGGPSSFPSDFGQVGNTAYFAASDGVNGNELWETDGTSAGTHLSADVRPGGSGSSPANLTTLGSKLVFDAFPASGGYRVMTWDGTTLTTLAGDASTSIDSGLVVAGGRAYFDANDSSNGTELWSTDGTSGGTALVKNINPGLFSSDPEGLAAIGSRLVFVATERTSGRELWTTDGTSGGTQLLRDIVPGADSSDASLLGVAGGFAYYVADDGEHGNELWKTDGTAAGTTLASDAWAGPSDSYPSGGIAALGDRVVFGATLPNAGTEPVVLAPDPPVIPILGPGTPSTPKPSPTLTFSLPKSGKLSTKKGTITLKITVPAAGKLTIDDGSATKKTPKSKVIIEHSTASSKAAGTLTVVVKPTAAALKKLKAARKGGKPGTLKVKVKATFVTAAGQTLTSTQSFTLKLK